MGADFQCRSFPGTLTGKELTEQFNALCQEAAYEHGHGPYSGSWGEKLNDGLQISSKTFASYSEADDYVVGKASKCGPALAVKIVNQEVGRRFPATASDKNLAERLANIEKELAEFGGNLIKRVRSQKSKTKGCKSCGSSITVNHIRSTNCPVCAAPYLYTETDEKKYCLLETRRRVVEKRIQERVSYYAANPKKVRGDIWYVGAWCSS